jgi:hypothetical protein
MARKWSNLNLHGALHYVTGNYYWSSFRSFYSQGNETLAVDHDWWWPDDSEKCRKR